MYRKDIIDRISRIKRLALYDGMTAAKERAIARLWSAFHHAIVEV